MDKPFSYLVIAKYDPKNKKGLKITPQHEKCLQTLQVGKVINAQDYSKEHYDEFTLHNGTDRTNYLIVKRSLAIAARLGLVKKTTTDPISFEDFCKLESVEYFKNQLRSSKRKNPVNNSFAKFSPTQRLYIGSIWKFSNWLSGKEFVFNRLIQTGIDNFKQEKQSVILKDIEHFLNLYQEPNSTASDYVKIIKKYLLDEVHNGKKSGSITCEFYAIKGYFEKNDSEISFKFDPKVKYQIQSDEDQSLLSLDEFHKMLTVGNPSITQKAMLLCKFHRGLDTSTLVDRFNFEAWPQLVKWFGTEEYFHWDLSKCPAPVKLTRMKTDYPHIGFLDVDAIQSLIDYLNYRETKTNAKMKMGFPLFLTSNNTPVYEGWVRNAFRKCAKNAGIQHRLDSYVRKVKYDKDSHELRDLLKSILITSGTRYDVADHCIGHKPKDSYEKQARLYPDDLRLEYSKASKKLNIFSEVSSYLNGSRTIEAQQKQIQDLKERVAVMQKQREELEEIFTRLESITQSKPKDDDVEWMDSKIREFEQAIL